MPSIFLLKLISLFRNRSLLSDAEKLIMYCWWKNWRLGWSPDSEVVSIEWPEHLLFFWGLLRYFIRVVRWIANRKAFVVEKVELRGSLIFWVNFGIFPGFFLNNCRVWQSCGLETWLDDGFAARDSFIIILFISFVDDKSRKPGIATVPVVGAFRKEILHSLFRQTIVIFFLTEFWALHVVL